MHGTGAGHSLYPCLWVLTMSSLPSSFYVLVCIATPAALHEHSSIQRDLLQSSGAISARRVIAIHRRPKSFVWASCDAVPLKSFVVSFAMVQSCEVGRRDLLERGKQDKWRLQKTSNEDEKKDDVLYRSTLKCDSPTQLFRSARLCRAASPRFESKLGAALTGFRCGC